MVISMAPRIRYLHQVRACVSRPRKILWVSFERDPRNTFRSVVPVKQTLRKGDASVLNVYYTSLSTGLGKTTFPWECADVPNEDGVVIIVTSIRGGSNPDFREKDKRVHEVGP